MVISTQGRYTRTAIVLHWLILALLVAQYIVGWTMPHIGRNTPVTTLISLHFSIGVLILGVIVVRLIWRAIHGEPAPEAGIPPWQVRSARAIHWLLYLLLVVVPLLGWINASYRGMPITFFGFVHVPQLVATQPVAFERQGVPVVIEPGVQHHAFVRRQGRLDPFDRHGPSLAYRRR